VPIVSTMIMMRMRIVIVMIVTTTVIVIKPDRRVRLVAGAPLIAHVAMSGHRVWGLPVEGSAPAPGFYSRR